MKSGKLTSVENISSLSPLKAPVFATTRWSVVLACRNENENRSREALAEISQSYWRPVYACIRHHGHSEHDAQDLTQDFFVRLLSGKLKYADQSRGRFRAYISVALQNFLRDHKRRQWTWRRGRGNTLISLDGQEAEEGYSRTLATQDTPELLYDRQWAALVVENAIKQLRTELAAQGREVLIAHFDAIFAGTTRDFPFQEVARQIGVSVGTLHKTLHHCRGRFQVLLREEVARTVASKREIDDELLYLKQVFVGVP